MARRWKIFLLVGLFTLIADQASKVWARHELPVHPTPCAIPDDVVARKCVGTAVSVIDGFWDWRLSFNPGSAFGLFDSQGGARVFLSIIGILAVLAMIVMVKKAKNDQRLLAIALGLVAGGATTSSSGAWRTSKNIRMTPATSATSAMLNTGHSLAW